MANSIYSINKGINKSLVFKGLKGQYIWYMGGAMFVLLIIYAVMYLIKVNTYICLAIILCLGALSTIGIYHLSSIYGEHGLTKALAKRSIPNVVRSCSRKAFQKRQN